jgi:integrase/recombinase XerC
MTTTYTADPWGELADRLRPLANAVHLIPYARRAMWAVDAGLVAAEDVPAVERTVASVEAFELWLHEHGVEAAYDACGRRTVDNCPAWCTRQHEERIGPDEEIAHGADLPGGLRLEQGESYEDGLDPAGPQVWVEQATAADPDELERHGRALIEAAERWRRLLADRPDPDGCPRAVAGHLEWLRLRGLRPSTILTRRNRLAHLGRALHADDLLAVTEGQLRDWERSLRLTAGARAAYVCHVQAFYRWAHAEGLIDVDPSLRLVVPKVPRRLPRPIPQDDLLLAVAAAPRRIRPWLVLAAWAGLRAREIALLERQDVREANDPPVLLVADGKGGKQRIVPMSTFVRQTLFGYGLPKRAGYVFDRQDGQAGHNAPSLISHLANEHLHGLGIDDTLHSLRHSFGTRLYAECKDLRLTQEVLGHDSPSTTAGYVAYSPGLAAEAVQRLARRPE